MLNDKYINWILEIKKHLSAKFHLSVLRNFTVWTCTFLWEYFSPSFKFAIFNFAFFLLLDLIYCWTNKPNLLFIYLFIFLCIGSFPLLVSPDSESFCSVNNVEPASNGHILAPWANHLKDFPLYLSQLNNPIRSFNIKLTDQSLFYLKMLNHIIDLTDEDITLSVFWRTFTNNNWFINIFYPIQNFQFKKKIFKIKPNYQTKYWSKRS